MVARCCLVVMVPIIVMVMVEESIRDGRSIVKGMEGEINE